MLFAPPERNGCIAQRYMHHSGMEILELMSVRCESGHDKQQQQPQQQQQQQMLQSCIQQAWRL
jgi:hypothetical protein